MNGNTYSNHKAGGPRVYIALYGQALPSLNANSLVLTNNEVQSVAITGAPEGGTFTLEVVYPNGTSETTGAIAYDATAANVKTALAALNGLSADDIDTAGGPLPGSAVSVTFKGAYANTNMPMMTADGSLLTGGTTPAVAVTQTTQGRLWTRLPDPTKVSANFLAKFENFNPAFALQKEGSTLVEVGAESLSLTIAETDLEAANLGFLSTLRTTTAPGPAQVGYDALVQPSTEADIPYHTALLQYPYDRTLGWGVLLHMYRIRRLPDTWMTGEFGKRRELDLNFSCFGDENNGGLAYIAYKYNAPATS